MELLVWAARRVLRAYAMTEPQAFMALVKHGREHKGCAGADGCAEARKLHDAWKAAELAQQEPAA
jgi:hypothetical protein